MGSLYLRGKTWWMKVYIDGKPVQSSTGTTKKMVAKAILAAEERRLEDQKIPGVRVIDSSFDDLVTLYLDDYKINGKKSIKRAEICVAHLKAEFGGRKSSAITSDDIRIYIGKRLESVKKATVNRELSAMKRMYALGVEQTPPLIGKPPKIKMLQENNVRKGFFEHHEFMAVRAALPPHLRPVVTFAYKSGWRLEEVLSLTWSRIDRANGCARADVTKNGDQRVVYFDQELADMIAEIWTIRKKNRAFSEYVFLNRSGSGRMLRFDKAWAAACKKAGVDRIFHDLRRTAIRNMVRSGVPEIVAMKISGQRTRSVFDRYNIVSDADLKRAAEKQAEYLERQNSMVTDLATVRHKKAKAV
jgi:integrase